jgi:endonuclease III
VNRVPPFKKTGAIWRWRGPKRKSVVRSVCTTLKKEYGRPRFGNPSDPLDDLIYIILSNKTSPRSAQKTYGRLKGLFQKWDDILSAPLTSIRRVLRPAGLSRVKSAQIRAALRTIKETFGRCDLRRLKLQPAAEVEDYLVGLPGVSEKVAKCVMIYALNLPVLPVDAHVHRISRRLGWTTRKRADQCHAELEALIPVSLRHDFHVDCIAHGRKICRPRNPHCNVCCIRAYCEFARAAE